MFQKTCTRSICPRTCFKEVKTRAQDTCSSTVSKKRIQFKQHIQETCPGNVQEIETRSSYMTKRAVVSQKQVGGQNRFQEIWILKTPSRNVLKKFCWETCSKNVCKWMCLRTCSKVKKPVQANQDSCSRSVSKKGFQKPCWRSMSKKGV